MTALLTHYEAAQYLDISPDLLKAHVENGDIPWVNLGIGEKRPRRKYRAADLEAFIEERTSRCQSINLQEGRTTSMTSSSRVLDFMARLDAQTKDRPNATRNVKKRASRKSPASRSASR